MCCVCVYVCVCVCVCVSNDASVQVYERKGERMKVQRS